MYHKEMSNIKLPVIIDTDPGTDDALAIMLAKTSDNIDIRALTVASGNVDINYTLNNTLKLAEILEIDAPIYKGADKPLLVNKNNAEEFHGESGLGNYIVKKTNRKAENEYAWDGIYEIVKNSNEKITIIALAPLTNIAISLIKYKDLPEYIEEIIIMGGSFGTYGNCAPYSEFNFWCDPHAAEIVIKSGIKLRIIGLNATRKGSLKSEELGLIMNENGELKKLMDGIFSFIEDSTDIGDTANKYHFPDALAVAAAIDKDIYEYEYHYVDCITDTGNLQGMTIIRDTDNVNVDLKIQIATELNRSKFIDMFSKISILGADMNV